ncbi:hypothetical protein J2847_005792 [Azospirillum agricola]|uniref:DUF1643 domain-containing protein n=1 Tax=Azospirillum agricola TaxID=1720247 RepID=UPI001AE84772|nr:DUF1643 domain-containing protein [Azospirillum agricola]MBP2232463.1 hypothetical protein [Azospirillum agricola]
MTLDLFDAAPSSTPAMLHAPGGKVKTALPPGLHGDAAFSPCGRYRHILRRWVGDEFPAHHWLLIGMNPSTADAAFNDPTIRREWGFTVREGYLGFVKANVGDFRATDPASLSGAGVEPRSGANLPAILSAATAAHRVVACWGNLPRPLAVFGEETVQILKESGVEMWCFGTNADGSPKHPLYLKGTTPLVRFRD